MFLKQPRIKNKKLLKEMQDSPCAVCGQSPSDPHHIRSKGAWGSDTKDNLIPLCRIHHTEIHAIGKKTFATKYKLKITAN